MITLIISAYNEEKYIGSCLDHALANTKGVVDEIIVVDNSSTDNTNKIVSQYAIENPNLRVVVERKKWLTMARQKWYLASKGDIIAYADADTHIDLWWASRIQETFEKNPTAWFISWPYSYYDALWYEKAVNWFYRRMFAYPSFLLAGYLGVWWNFAIKKSVLEAIHWFDTSIQFYWEDTDIARRAALYSKAIFDLNLVMPTSARRFTGQGRTKTVYIYIINFFSQVVQHKSTTEDYKDFR